MSEIRHQVLQNPISVSHVPEALQYLVTTDTILNDNPKLGHMLTWARISPITVTIVLSLDNKIYQCFSGPVLLQPSVSTTSNYSSIRCQNVELISCRRSFILYSSTGSSFTA